MINCPSFEPTIYLAVHQHSHHCPRSKLYFQTSISSFFFPAIEPFIHLANPPSIKPSIHQASIHYEAIDTSSHHLFTCCPGIYLSIINLTNQPYIQLSIHSSEGLFVKTKKNIHPCNQPSIHQTCLCYHVSLPVILSSSNPVGLAIQPDVQPTLTFSSTKPSIHSDA